MKRSTLIGIATTLLMSFSSAQATTIEVSPESETLTGVGGKVNIVEVFQAEGVDDEVRGENDFDVIWYDVIFQDETDGFTWFAVSNNTPASEGAFAFADTQRLGWSAIRKTRQEWDDGIEFSAEFTAINTSELALFSTLFGDDLYVNIFYATEDGYAIKTDTIASFGQGMGIIASSFAAFNGTTPFETSFVASSNSPDPTLASAPPVLSLFACVLGALGLRRKLRK